MSEERRWKVRATAEFFRDLDRQLRPERGPKGEPATGDFQTYDLLNIVDTFATRFDQLPEETPGDQTTRALLAEGRAVYAYVVIGRLADDGAVELTQLDIDTYQESGVRWVTGRWRMPRCRCGVVSAPQMTPLDLSSAMTDGS